MNDLLSAALDYASRGFPVFPCKNKMPLTPHGFHDATRETARLKAWWRRWPDAQIGVPTGRVSGLFVLDIDPDKGGDTNLKLLEAQHGELPDTPTVITGGGGNHHYFTMPETQVTTGSQGTLGAGIDTRGEGGYVIVPPSPHASGRAYEWDVAYGGETPLAPVPEWILHKLRQGRRAAEPLPEIIPEGQRESTLASIAGSMRRRGASESAILAALEVENAARCRPPLAQKDLARIARSVARYAPETRVVSAPAGESVALDWLGLQDGQNEDALRESMVKLFDLKEWHVDASSSGVFDFLALCCAHTALYLKLEETLDKLHWKAKRKRLFRMEIERRMPTQEPPTRKESPEIDDLGLHLDGRRRAKETFYNYTRILEHTNEWNGRLKFNEFEAKPTLDGLPVTDAIERQIAMWCGHEYGFSGDKYTAVSRAVYRVAEQHPYDPLKEYITQLPAWDQVSRLDKWLSTYCGAEPSEVNQAVGRVLIFQMLTRALHPGCIARVVVVLEGEENTGKSEAIAILGHPWSSTFKISMDTKEAYMQIRGKWVAELVELDTLHRTSETRLKAFITERSDEYVPKYANHAVNYQRRTVFIGSTNESRYLIGQTGNTRFLPVTTGVFDLAGLRRGRDQLFAEALDWLALNPDDHWWEEPGHIANEIKELRDSRRVYNPYVEPLDEWLNRTPQNQRDTTYWAAIVEGFFGGVTTGLTGNVQRLISQALKDLGWSQDGHKTRVDRRQHRLWRRPE